MSRTEEIKKIVDAFEKERDKLLDQVQYIKGHAERMEWVIKVMNNHIATIEKEEEQKAKYEAAAEIAREKGNIGVHPNQRKGDLAERKAQAQQLQQPQPTQQVVSTSPQVVHQQSSTEDSKKKIKSK